MSEEILNKEKIHVKAFNTLIAYQKGLELVDMIYDITSNFPKFETYELGSQLRRASTSVIGNLAEGKSQLYTKKEFSFYNNSLGSCGEIECWLEVCWRRKYISEQQYIDLKSRTIEIKKLLISYLNKLSTK
ncbi:four helix bundle protein [Clostridium sp. PL3]|uniref:Four helix bundle protein n=1 Tax=Clostridium thailandense TaxID=2794346 RepID=A0A949TTZ5_9CLOT|nr:four helix bundle protein [Clostridium thailandense]MBV7276452.1 four helix bundle protein [Clostridium thailandense]